MPHGRLPRLRSLVLVVAVVASVVVPIAAAPPAGAADEPVVVIRGRGWGHGRGMSQWGSLGYAVDHGLDWRQILSHYYSNTGEGVLPGLGQFLGVRLVGMDGQETIVVREAEVGPDGNGLRTSVTGATNSKAWRVAPDGTDHYKVYRGESCGGPWTEVGRYKTNEVTIGVPGPYSDDGIFNSSEDHEDLLAVCYPDGWRRWYHGNIRAVRGEGGAPRTVNNTLMDSYLRGVVPRESPAGWGDAGGGSGMNALRAQAVTARSYAAAENRYAYAKTCDTTSCQVYSGAFHSAPGGVAVSTQHPNTDKAIADTASVVRTLNGVPARTEYSSSTGGWTSGGTFPAVADLGDAYAGNPNHSWQVELSVAAIEARFPQIGHFTGLQVTRRNGLGADGGRVLEVVVRGSSGSVTRTGMQFRSDFMAKGNCSADTQRAYGCVISDWFTPIFEPAAGVATAHTGHWVVRVDGTVDNRDGAGWHGDMGGRPLNAPVLGMAGNPSGTGYWLVAADGGIFTFGSAAFHGSTGGMWIAKPVVGMASTDTGKGYWLVASDGGIFSFGDAAFHGSTGGMWLNRPIVGMARTPTGDGYWLVASDGGIFSFGDARFHGSTGAMTLAAPIVGMAPTPTGNGYWLVASDGGIFAFGDAKFYGSLGGSGVEAVGMAPSASGNGYWIVSENGTAYPFGDA